MFRPEFTRLFILAFALALVPACGRASDNPACAGSGTAAAKPAEPARNPKWAVPVNKDMNLFRITPTFYRSEQFTKKEVPELQKLGIRTAVSLRNFHSDDDELAGSDIKAVRVPTNTWAIGDKHVIAALAEIRRAEAAGPVVLHCQHGADRTGLVTAMYRIVYQGWTRDEALDELLNGGYGHHTVWKNIPKYIRSADAEKIRKAVEKKVDGKGGAAGASAPPPA